MITQTIVAAGQGWREAEIGQKGRIVIIWQVRDRLEALSSHNKERGVGEKNEKNGSKMREKWLKLLPAEKGREAEGQS